MVAESIDSYKDTLKKALSILNPVNIYEWGPGISTGIIEDYPSVKYINTVEDNQFYYDKAVKDFHLSDKVTIHYKNKTQDYPKIYADGPFQLVFVDGKMRSVCIGIVEIYLDEFSAIVLHDADRGEYRQAIDRFKYVFWEDDGNTVVLSNSDKFKDLWLI